MDNIMENINNNLDIITSQKLFCMKGGKKISEGGFGCVYYPEINCQGNTIKNTNYISKIQKKDISSDIEEYNGRIIQKIYNYKLFYAPVIEQCPIELSRLKQGDIQECNIFKKKGINKQFILQKIPYIKGKSFLDYFFNKNNYYHNKKQETLMTLYDSFPYLLISIQKLYQQGFIHYDIKKENIMYDTERNIPIIIDFGLTIHIPSYIYKNKFNINDIENTNFLSDKMNINISKENIDFDNLSNYFYVYATDYYLWCPEIHYICYLLHRNKSPSNNEIQNIVNDIINNSYLKNIFSEDFISIYQDFLSSFLFQFEGKNWKDVITQLLQHYNKWDNFSLCFMYIRIIYNILKQSTIDFYDYLREKETIFTEFIIILMDGLHPDPNIRSSTFELINNFENLFIKYYNKQGKEYEYLYNLIHNNEKEISSSLKKEETFLSTLQSKYSINR